MLLPFAMVFSLTLGGVAKMAAHRFYLQNAEYSFGTYLSGNIFVIPCTEQSYIFFQGALFKKICKAKP